nr:hypothetical protein MarFTME_053 [Marseillevirus futianmevirus]
MESWEQTQKIKLKFSLYFRGGIFSGKACIEDPTNTKRHIIEFLDRERCCVEFSKDFSISLYQGVTIEYRGCSINFRQEYDDDEDIKEVRDFLSNVLEKLE